MPNHNVKSSSNDGPTNSVNKMLLRCLTANDEDFLDEFPRLPPEANPLDARFTDPRVLAGQVRPDVGANVFGFGNDAVNMDLWGLQGNSKSRVRKILCM